MKKSRLNNNSDNLERNVDQTKTMLAKEEWEKTFDAIPDLIMILDPQNHIMQANRAVAEATGLSREELVGKRCHDIIHGLPEPPSYCPHLQTKSTGQEHVSEFYEAHLKKHFIFSATPLRGSRGDLLGVVEVARDITERQSIETSLKESEDKFRDLYENAPIAYFAVSPEGLVKQCNRRAVELLGYPRESLIGKPVFKLYADTAYGLPKAKKVFERFLAGEETRAEEIQMQKADGSPVWVDLTVNIIRDGQGRMLETRSAVIDITERKRVEEALRESEEQFRMIAHSTIDAVISSDDRSRVIQWNPSAERIFGYSEEEIIGRPLSLVISENARRDHASGMDRYLATGKSDVIGSTYESTGLRKNGEEFPVEISLATWKKAGNDFFTGIIRDTTERKNYERRLEERARQQAAAARIGKAAVTSASMEDVMGEAVTLLAETLDVEYTQILEASEDRQALFMRAGHGWTQKDFRQTAFRATRNSQAGYTLLADEPVLVDDLKAETRFSDPQLLLDHKVVSGMSVVIPGERTPFGILAVHTSRKRQFSKIDLNFLQSIAHILAETITRIRAEDALRQSERFAHTTLDALSAHIAVLDQSGKVLDVNKAWRDFADANPPVLPNYGKGLNYLEICDAATGERAEGAIAFADGIRAVIAGEKEMFTIEYPCHSPSVKRWFIGRVTRFPSDSKVSVVVSHENITDRKEAEEALKRYAEIRTVLLREVNHRVKNNLSAIIGMLHIEQDRAATDGLNDLAPVFDKLVGRIEGLSAVHSTLSASGWQPLNISRLCDSIIRSTLKHASLIEKVNLDVEPVDIEVNSDQAHHLAHLALVINELSTNSIKHAMTDSESILIEVRFEKVERQVAICFQDNGPGYPEGMINGKWSKTGVGFELIRRIVSQSLGGQVLLENKPGALTKIVFKLLKPKSMEG